MNLELTNKCTRFPKLFHVFGDREVVDEMMKQKENIQQ